MYLHVHMHVYTCRQVDQEAIHAQQTCEAGFMWVRADAVTGYFCDIEVYVGKPSDGTISETGVGERVVLQLSECLRCGNYQLFCDNYFISCWTNY